MTTKPTYNVALVGNPKHPCGQGAEGLFNDAALRRVRELGFDAVQVNIAWGSRPGGEPLNLEDVVMPPGRQPGEAVRTWNGEIRRRSALCRRHGLRALFHFGAPRVDGTLYKLIIRPDFVEGQNVTPCISDPATAERYAALLGELARQCPEIDDVMVYTYDQEAWICSEFGACPRCRGIPLHDRLPGFLLELNDAWHRHRPGGWLFWEPWELSAGQVYKSVEALAARGPVGMGLMLHGNVAEVMMTHSCDPWLRNTARLAVQAGLPVVAEAFLGGATEEVEPLQNVVVPRLVYESVRRLQGVSGVVGIKEYYGLARLDGDVNLAMAGLALRDPGLVLEQALDVLAKPFGEAAQGVIRGWELAAQGMALYPWDLCWRFRYRTASFPPVHPWDAFWFNGHLCDSPSWCSTRRTVYMATETEGPLHSWLLEDISLRWQMAAERFEQAMAEYEAAQALAPASCRQDLADWARDLRVLATASRNYWRHTQETLLARMMRLALRTGAEIRPEWISRLQALLEEDAAAQAPWLSDCQRQAVGEVIAGFSRDPVQWLERYLTEKQTEIFEWQKQLGAE